MSESDSGGFDLDLSSTTFFKPVSERHCRRGSWTCGPLVRLSDGQYWYLPRFDLFLLVAVPGLIDKYDNVVTCGLDMNGEVSGDNSFDCRSRYLSAVREVAMLLLAANYDLDHEFESVTTNAHWQELTIFRLPDFSAFDFAAYGQFSAAVANAINLAWPTWAPMFMEHYLDRRNVTFLN